MKQLGRLFLASGWLFATSTIFCQTGSTPSQHWLAAWATSEDMAPSVMEKPVLPPGMKMPDFKNMPKRPSPNIPKDVENQTIRLIVRPTVGGRRLRIELSNAFGKDIVSIGSTHVAVRTNDDAIDSRTDVPVTFGGSAHVDIRPGVVLVSDPINFNLEPMSDLAVSLFVLKAEGTPTNHTLGLHTSYVASGDQAGSASLTSPTQTTAYTWLRSIDVEAQPKDYAVACLGDSITDGFTTTVDKNQAWPTLLAVRLREAKHSSSISVLNEGISGNQVLRDGAGVSALARFDRDVLSEPGVRWVILLEGINDINLHGQTTGEGALVADDLIRGYEQLITRAHIHNVKIIGATLTPDAGIWLAGPVGEATRQKVNQWIRTSGEFDGLIDFDAATRDEKDPTHLKPEFDSGDHIHPNDAGNAAMANAIPIEYFLPR